jgi:hypothetical protein
MMAVLIIVMTVVLIRVLRMARRGGRWMAVSNRVAFVALSGLVALVTFVIVAFFVVTVRVHGSLVEMT